LRYSRRRRQHADDCAHAADRVQRAGSLAGLIGSLGRRSRGSRYALEIPWRVFAGEHFGGVAVTAVMVAAIGVLSSLDVLRHKPLATLRAE
jgi:hypothetical protein